MAQAFGAIAELLDNVVDEIRNGATFVIIDKTLNPRNGSPALLIQGDGGGMDPDAMRRCLSFGFSVKKSKSTFGQYGNGFKTRYDRIVVPIVDYEVNKSTGALDNLHSKEHYIANLSMLLQWSPYSTEEELLKQFEDVGYHGTKAVIYNLWFNDEDSEDILIVGEPKTAEKGRCPTTANGQHLANRLRYSLCAYLSVLYLRIPETFCILLRGPRSGGSVEGTVVTTIGFLKEAPHVNIHGFNVYHKNRLILPFWHVVKKNPQAPTTSQVSSDFGSHHDTHQPVVLGGSFSAAVSTTAPAGANLKRKKYDDLAELDKMKRMALFKVAGMDADMASRGGCTCETEAASSGLNARCL
ncbi:unnamed protein product [Ilex paraguariensis]|uniref:Morc S5 domain-containing protein n=1 Tax=Ilex paraguariensis TaxID=185542 RepID=A0ABC8TT47_9AQUA